MRSPAVSQAAGAGYFCASRQTAETNFIAALTESIRADLMRTPIKVTTMFPGYIRSEINEKVKKTPFMVDTETGCRALVKAIEKEPATACMPWWPRTPLGILMRNLPLRIVARMG